VIILKFLCYIHHDWVYGKRIFSKNHSNRVRICIRCKRTEEKVTIQGIEVKDWAFCLHIGSNYYDQWDSPIETK
jgi:hypothetical protein